MKNIDKLITALYYAKSDKREQMLTDLILTVMFSANKYLDIQAIIDLIEEYFLLVPIKYEVKQCLISLSESKQISQVGTNYCLTEITQSQIHTSLIKGKDNLEKRIDSFSKIVNDISGEIPEKFDVQKLWDGYNEYLLECFMVHGRKAINIFLPYKIDELPENDSIFEQLKMNLKSEKLCSIFTKLIIECPNRLTEAELRHLNGLASRAEKFYSLGVEKEEYDKIKNLQIKNLIVLVDTNILYTVLDLRSPQDKSAITEITRLANDKIIDFRIVYLPKTYKELQRAKKPLENLILREKFKYGQIKAMLASGHLDVLAKQYYENKLQNSDYPHPADKINYASDILKQMGIMLYNQHIPEIEEDKEYLNKIIEEYLEYQRYYNKIADEKGEKFHLSKDLYNIEHDVCLREGILNLKGKGQQEILQFVCLTTDRSLIRFDQFMMGKDKPNIHKVINPNFMMPSVFIKKIRPFIPIITNNYRKAFFSSLTAPVFHKEVNDEREKTILTQKSLTYFNNLGIEDEDIICDILKREMFLEEFSRHEKENTVEDFIKSEIAKEIGIIKMHKISLEKEIELQKKSTEHAIRKEKEASEKLKAEKETSEKVKQSEIDNLLEKIKEKESLERQLKKLNDEQTKFSRDKSIEMKNNLLEELNQSILTLENVERPLRDIIDSKYKMYKWAFSIIPVLYFFIICFFIYEFTWNVMEQYTYLSSLFVSICAYLYFAISGKSFNPLKRFNNTKTKIIAKVFSKFKYNVDHLNNRRQRKTQLELEIAELKKQ